MTSLAPPQNARRRLRLRVFGVLLLLCVVAYFVLAYWLAPFFWRHFEHQRAIADRIRNELRLSNELIFLT